MYLCIYLSPMYLSNWLFDFCCYFIVGGDGGGVYASVKFHLNRRSDHLFQKFCKENYNRV